MKTVIKTHVRNEFYVKAIRNGYYKVIDGYDESMASLECSKLAADKLAAELNKMRQVRLGL